MNILLFGLTIIVGACGSIFMKIGSSGFGAVHISNATDAINFIIKIFTSTTVLFGMFLYFLSALLFTYLITKFDVSFVQPILALTYVVTPILAIFFLDEKIPILRWAGIIVVILGVIIVSRSSR